MSSYGPPPGPFPGPGGPAPGYGRPPRRKGSANGLVAAAVAGAIIALGTVLAIVLVTSDANTDARAAGAPSGSSAPTAPPSGSRSSIGGLPSGARTSIGGGGGGSDLSGATFTGNQYFTDLGANLYYSSMSQWCTGATFPLAQSDVESVVSAYAQGSATGSDDNATMTGHVELDTGRSGSVTISLRPAYSGSSRWCIYGQS